MREEEFNELMEEWNDEIEAIAGQPDVTPEPTNRNTSYGEYMLHDYPHGPQSPEEELTCGEMDAVRKKAADAHNKSVRGEEMAVDKAVDNPSHYDVADTTVQKMLEAMFTHEELMGWIKGNIIKYRMRAYRKGKVGAQDIAKAAEYQKFYDEYLERNTQ